MHCSWDGLEEQFTFLSGNKTWLEKQILHILLSETEIQEGLCFVSFVQTKITGVWWGAKCSAYGTALKFFEIMVQRTFYRKGKWISFSTETIIV